MKNCNRFKLYVFVVCVCVANVSDIQSQENFSIDSIETRMQKQLEIFPQEKIHIHNDKPVYLSGEKIWFRAHLIDAYSNKYDSTSIYIYGELISPLDSIVDRIKIRRNDIVYAGYFNLDEEYPAGTYTMRFYTKFLESLGDDYFFKKNVEIGGPFSTKFNTELNYIYRDDNKKLDIELRFKDQKTGAIIAPENIAIGYRKEHLSGFDKENLIKLKLNEEQSATINLNVSKEPVRSLYVEYVFEDNLHREFINIGAPKDDFNVDFFPEGGHLLGNARMNISFKALYSDGLSASVGGVVYVEGGDTITSFESIHNGMGVFPFYAEVGKKYLVKCRTKDGMTKTFSLPKAVTDTYGLVVQNVREMIGINVLSADGQTIPDNLSLLVHSRGRLIYANSWDVQEGVVQFNASQLPIGVIHCLLVNDHYEIISERLFFNNQSTAHPKIMVYNDKEVYKKREKVVSKLTFRNKEGSALSGNFSVSVTDNKDVRVDSTQNILTNLLLTSELKGYIENPAYYFQNKRVSGYVLDILMQTQGWRKYNIPKVIKGDVEYPKGILEYCQMITGDVRDGILLNRKSKDIPISLLSLANPPFVISELSDESGRFMFRTDLPDSLSIAIQANTKKGGRRVLLEVDSEKFPAFQKSLPILRRNKQDFFSFFEKADLKYTAESGMRMVHLKGIEVVADNVKRSKYSSNMNTLYDSKYFLKMGAHSLRDILNRIGGVTVRDDKVYIRTNTEPASLYVDDLEDSQILSFDPPIEEIESLEISKSGTSFLGHRGVNGVVLITTKRGYFNIPSIPPLNMKKIRLLGYQSAVEFYSPKYETYADKNRMNLDLRTTLYWNPYVEIKEGEAEVIFYTADEASEYTLYIDGVSDDGEPLHQITTIGVLE